MPSAAHLPLYLTPDATLLLFSLGLALIYLELNRPGSVLPGATGLLAVLLSIASFLHFALDPASFALILTAFALLGLDLLRRTHLLVAIAATLALVLGFRHLVQFPWIHPFTAIFCGLLIGGGTSALTRIARRARANKGLD